MVQIPEITNDDEELAELVKQINNRLDQIANEFNTEQSTDSDLETSESATEGQITVLEGQQGRYYRFGLISASNAPNSSLFEDPADGSLKWKDRTGTVTVIV